MRRVALGAVLVAACANTQRTDATLDEEVAQLISRTQTVIDDARTAVQASGGTGKEQYRGAVMRQDAARQAMKKEKPHLAAKFSLQARTHAAKAMATSGVSSPLARQDPKEKTLKQGADDDEHDRWMESVEKRTPPADELLRQSSEAELRSRVDALLGRSEEVLREARSAAKHGGEAKDKFRGAWMRQEAARQALREGRVRLAAKFGLQSRKLANKVVEANGNPTNPALRETAAEKELKQPVDDAPDAEYDRRLAAIERKTPPVNQLLGEKE